MFSYIFFSSFSRTFDCLLIPSVARLLNQNCKWRPRAYSLVSFSPFQLSTSAHSRDMSSNFHNLDSPNRAEILLWSYTEGSPNNALRNVSLALSPRRQVTEIFHFTTCVSDWTANSKTSCLLRGFGPAFHRALWNSQRFEFLLWRFTLFFWCILYRLIEEGRCALDGICCVPSPLGSTPAMCLSDGSAAKMEVSNIAWHAHSSLPLTGPFDGFWNIIIWSYIHQASRLKKHARVWA